MCPRKDKTPYQWENVYKASLEKNVPEKNDHQLLTEGLLAKANEELKEDYKDASTAQKKNLPILKQKMEKEFFHAQAEIAKYYYLFLSSQVEKLQSDQLLLKEAVEIAARKKESAIKALSDIKTKISQNEKEIVQKKRLLSSPIVLTDESLNATPAPPPPPPPPPLVQNATKPLKLTLPKQELKKAATKKELTPKKDVAGKLAEELKKGKPSLKHIDPDALHKEKEIAPTLPLIKPSRKKSEREQTTPVDLFSVIDSITDNPEPQVKRNPEQMPELKAMLRKIDAKEKELLREKKTLSEMGNLVLLYGEDTSSEARALQEETQTVIMQSQSLLAKQQAKLKQLDEFLALQKELRDAQNPLSKPSAIAVDLPSETPTDKLESTIPNESLLVAPPPPPPPPPMPLTTKRATRSKQTITPNDKTDPPVMVKSEKKPPKVETLAGLAKLFDDPKFQERRKRKEQEELSVPKTEDEQVKQRLKTSSTQDKEHSLVLQREKIAAFLVENKEVLNLRDDPEIHFMWRQQKEALDKESSKLESIEIPNIDELKKHNTLLKNAL